MRVLEVGGQPIAHQLTQPERYQLELDRTEDLPGYLDIDPFPDDMVGGPWVEVYSPNGKNNYSRRRCRINVGGHIRKKYIKYLGGVTSG